MIEGKLQRWSEARSPSLSEMQRELDLLSLVKTNVRGHLKAVYYHLKGSNKDERAKYI